MNTYEIYCKNTIIITVNADKYKIKYDTFGYYFEFYRNDKKVLWVYEKEIIGIGKNMEANNV